MELIIARVMMLLVIALVSLTLVVLFARDPEGSLSDRTFSAKVLVGAALICSTVILFVAPDPGAVYTLQDGGFLMQAIYWLAVAGGAWFVFSVIYDRLRNPSSKPKATALVRNDIRRVAFDYIDQDGNLTTREITAERYRNGKIFAYCHLRKAERSFFVSSIQGEVVDVSTGEVLNKKRLG